MTKYESLLVEAEKHKIKIKEIDFGDCEECGYYSNNKVLINRNLLDKQKHVILAEELGHYNKTVGNITNQNKIENVKQEKKARNWGYEKLVGIIDIVNAYNSGARNRCELAEYLEVTEEFLEEAIQHYREKYGAYFEIDNYIVMFEPHFGIIKKF
ncbi:hypothetical protein CLLI_22100 [Clostridium liquoris]|jgi:Zn-dependent peptidase ImmA (M78 family)|uniref:IrrE N-terminal-like domain-containing protein n=1 Tax=Clostridium liquoris TaxID=1289519 RepID=A0A2T0B1Q5_9CLOT|nr:ImmA/IrrE family metallo-endopeptidase [Clostridium liquoris]PRR77646.1 hypothetical protein CLLI_22100 [Clostridium liquoris]